MHTLPAVLKRLATAPCVCLIGLFLPTTQVPRDEGTFSFRNPTQITGLAVEVHATNVLVYYGGHQ